MAIDKEIKKKVIKDWQNAFPELTMYSQNKLYKVVGPIVTGIELIKLPHSDEYRPHFHMYPLWRENVAKCLDYPIYLHEYYNRRRFQYNIPYENHAVFFNDAVATIKTETSLSFKDNISLNKVLDALDEYARTSYLRAAPDSYLQAALQANKLKIALFINAVKAKSIFDEIKIRNWDMHHFKACGIDINEWIQGLKETIDNREEFLKRIAINKQDKKILKLQCSELTEDSMDS
jgi:hypothetical protein